MKILIAVHHPFDLWNAPPWLAERLRAAFPQHQVEQIPGYEGLASAIADADVLLSWSVRPEQFARARRLKWIHSPAAAVHQLMFPELVASDVLVSNARSVHGPVVAEHALALLLALAKRLPQSMRLQAQHRWGQEEIWRATPTVRELRGSRLCLIGMGSIGRELTLRAKALGMHVTAVREHPESGPDGADEVVGPAELPQALPDSDFVVLALPLTDSSRRLVDAGFLAKMKRSAYLINVGRGPLIEDAALLRALREGELAGAALDVFENEPLPEDSPYWSEEKVLITPHTAAVTERLWERHFDLFRENVGRFTAGEALLGQVDKSKGY